MRKRQADPVPPITRAKRFGFHRAMDHLGAVAGPILAFLFLLLVGGSYRANFWPASIPAAPCVVVLVATVRDIPAQGPPRRLPLHTLRPYDRRFRRLLGVVTRFTLGNSRDAFLLRRAREAGVTESTVPLLWAALHVVKSMSSLGAGIPSDRVGRWGAIVAGWLIYAGFAARASSSWPRWCCCGCFWAGPGDRHDSGWTHSRGGVG
jgi:hypothetical protein